MGFFLFMVGDVVVMVLGMNIGVVYFVVGGGGDIEGDFGKKIEEDLVVVICLFVGCNGCDFVFVESVVFESCFFIV